MKSFDSTIEVLSRKMNHQVSSTVCTIDIAKLKTKPSLSKAEPSEYVSSS
jgi:hypothetical protein